jgi:PTS system mannitol-specific IIC component
MKCRLPYIIRLSRKRYETFKSLVTITVMMYIREEFKMKERVQVFGRFLSGMVMPNIGAFIAWGIITALFIETGWAPNEKLAALVGPMITYLLPLLIAYTGGKVVGGARGGVIGTIATMGIIVATSVPMFLGAMIVGPLAGFVIKKVDKALEDKIPAGFEMLVNNFSLGIIGALLTVLAYFGFAPLILGLTNLMALGVQFFVDHGLLPYLLNQPKYYS